MKHIFLIFYILSFGTGAGAAVILNMLYKREKLKIIKLGILINLTLLLTVILNFTGLYIQIMPFHISEWLKMLQVVSVDITSAANAYIAMMIAVELTNIDKKRAVIASYWLLTLFMIGVILLISLLFVNQRALAEYGENISYLIITSYSSIMVIFNLGILFLRKDKLNKNILGIVRVSAVLIIILTLISQLNDMFDFGAAIGTPVALSPFFYFAVNIMIIYHSTKYMNDKYLTVKTETSGDGKINEFNTQNIEITAREKEITELIARGLNNQEIADSLFISAHTVKNHISNIYQKLNVKNRVELINYISAKKSQ